LTECSKYSKENSDHSKNQMTNFSGIEIKSKPKLQMNSALGGI
jgi:hypothetical protein